MLRVVVVVVSLQISPTNLYLETFAIILPSLREDARHRERQINLRRRAGYVLGII